MTVISPAVQPNPSCDNREAIDITLRGTCGPDYRAVLDRVLRGAFDQHVADADTSFENDADPFRCYLSLRKNSPVPQDTALLAKRIAPSKRTTIACAPVTSQYCCETKKKHTCRAMACGHLGDEGVPDVLITRDDSECRRDREVVENLDALLVLHAGARRELADGVFEFPTDDVVVEPHPKTVIWPAVP